jgi:choline dehydrogenase-like flavoprotein
VVVGTGFASTFFLKKYLEKAKKDAKILVLERGMRFPHSDRLAQMRGNEPTYKHELKGYPDTLINPNKNKTWFFDPNFGGSSNCWWGCTPRFMPNDLKMKSLYGQGQDWPVTYEELEPFYCEAEAIIGVSGPDDTPYAKSKPYPLPSHKFSTVDKVMKSAYGAQYVSMPTARASRAIGNRGVCCASYTCNVCPVDSKFTIENTLQDVYKDARVTLLLKAQVSSLLLENGLAKKVYYEYNGVEWEADAELVVLGANAIFNAHLLLKSGDSHPLTGVGISEQRGAYATVYLDGLSNVGGSSSLTAHGYMLYDGDFRKDYASCLIESHNGPFIRNERGKWRQLAKFKFVFEDLPDAQNKVVLSDDPTKPKVDFVAHTDYVTKSKVALDAKINDLFACLPVERIDLDTYFQDSEAHNLSSVRMAASKDEGVVDKHMIHHNYRNLLVLGGSSFPTITSANPTLTISALSLMSANHLMS